MQDHYNRRAEQNKVINVQDLLSVGDKVRIRVNQPRGSNKIAHLPFSKEVYTIKQVRKFTRSYLLELERPNRQPLQILCHHRRVKQVFGKTISQITDQPSSSRTNISERRASTEIAQVSSNSENSSPRLSPPTPTVRTRTGRVTTKPKYLQDYS